MKNHRHTLVDHRPGGPRVSLGAGTWCAIDIAHVRAERSEAAVSAYETLVEHFQSAHPGQQSSAIVRSHDHRRVVAFVELRGHVEFAQLASAWDVHRLYAEHRENAESVALALYRVFDAAGDARIDPASSDCYEVERIAQPASRAVFAVKQLALALGFRGALLLGSDDETSSLIVYRFEHAAEFEAFRASTPAVALLGPVGATGETVFAVHPVKTFGASA